MNKQTKKLLGAVLSVLGFVLLLAAIWLGAYFTDATMNSWANWPTIATSTLFGILGGVGCFVGAFFATE
jgi:hypothetical protein